MPVRPKRLELVLGAIVGVFFLLVLSPQGQCTFDHPDSRSTTAKRHGKISFEDNASGRLIRDRTAFGFTSYLASDGINLLAIYTTFDDAAQAQAAFDRELAKAEKVIKKGKKNKEGQIVGERAQIVLLGGQADIVASKPDERFAAVVWTDGASFHEIESSSLRDVLALEKVYKY